MSIPTVPLIPVFIICRNHLSNAQRSLSQISRFPAAFPIIVDSASSYPPLLEWLDALPARQVWRHDRNVGCWGLWSRETPESKTPLEMWLNERTEEYGLSRDYFCFTDDDLDFEGVPRDLLGILQFCLDRHPRFKKAGPALRIDDIPDDYPLKENIAKDQDRFWVKEVDSIFGTSVYDADLDTTFAMYRRRDLATIPDRGAGKSLRVAGTWQTRHLGWYKTIENMTEEDWYALAHTEAISSYWSASLKIYCDARGIDPSGILASVRGDKTAGE